MDQQKLKMINPFYFEIPEDTIMVPDDLVSHGMAVMLNDGPQYILVAQCSAKREKDTVVPYVIFYYIVDTLHGEINRKSNAYKLADIINGYNSYVRMCEKGEDIYSAQEWGHPNPERYSDVAIMFESGDYVRIGYVDYEMFRYMVDAVISAGEYIGLKMVEFDINSLIHSIPIYLHAFNGKYYNALLMYTPDPVIFVDGNNVEFRCSNERFVLPDLYICPDEEDPASVTVRSVFKDMEPDQYVDDGYPKWRQDKLRRVPKYIFKNGYSTDGLIPINKINDTYKAIEKSPMSPLDIGIPLCRYKEINNMIFGDDEIV